MIKIFKEAKTMNVGFDGTLHPSGSTAQSTYSPVDENIAHKVRQASPDVKGLLDSISSVAAMIGEFEEKSRERNYNVDSQKLRLDYAQAMSGEMNAMAMKQYADKDSFMRDYEQREANVRESVLSRARGDGESAGYFRNWARYGNLVSQDLELLSGSRVSVRLPPTGIVSSMTTTRKLIRNTSKRVCSA